MSAAEPLAGEPDSPLHAVYLAQLREHAVLLTWLGYRRLDPKKWTTGNEDDITGELVKEMQHALQDDHAPEWAEYYGVHEQQPTNVADKLGNSRPRIDIAIERNQRGRRPLLRFEAKRLGPGHTARGYLGTEGLRAFVDDYYPTTHGEAGMLGYVQSDTVPEWMEKLTTELTEAPATYRIAADGTWKALFPAPNEANCTGHVCASGTGLSIIHILLPFHPN